MKLGAFGVVIFLCAHFGLSPGQEAAAADGQELWCYASPQPRALGEAQQLPPLWWLISELQI